MANQKPKIVAVVDIMMFGLLVVSGCGPSWVLSNCGSLAIRVLRRDQHNTEPSLHAIHKWRQELPADCDIDKSHIQGTGSKAVEIRINN